jgi:hypothetical protein
MRGLEDVVSQTWYRAPTEFDLEIEEYAEANLVRRDEHFR